MSESAYEFESVFQACSYIPLQPVRLLYEAIEEPGEPIYRPTIVLANGQIAKPHGDAGFCIVINAEHRIAGFLTSFTSDDLFDYGAVPEVGTYSIAHAPSSACNESAVHSTWDGAYIVTGIDQQFWIDCADQVPSAQARFDEIIAKLCSGYTLSDAFGSAVPMAGDARA